MTTKPFSKPGPALKLLLVLTAVTFGCGGQDPEPESQPTETTKMSALGSGLPTAAGWWSFDEKCTTTTVYDTRTVPAPANGSKTGGAGCVEGQIGRAISFDGVDDAATIPDRSNLHFTTAMTISAWVKPTSTSAAGHIAGKWDSPNSYRLSLTAGKPVFTLTMTGGAVTSVTGPSALPTSSYSHVAGVYDGAAMRLYVNGTQVATTARTGSLLNSNAQIRVGKLSSGSALAGSVDELRLYGVALTAVQVNRLANGLAHRRIRAVAMDPKLAGSQLRLHTQFPDWRTPETVLQYWVDWINTGAGQTVYLPEDGSYTSAIKYLEEVPWNNTSWDCLTYQQGNALTVQTAEQFMTEPHPALPTDIYRIFKATNPSLPFDLIADANGQFFHELIVITPPDAGFGREGNMVANTTDGTAFGSHDGILRFAGLQTNKKFIFHGVSFTRDDRNLEQYMHRLEAAMSHAFSDVLSVDPSFGCGAPGIWIGSHDVHDLQSPWDLFTVQDTQKVPLDNFDNYFVLAEAHVGNAHRLPNTVPEYVRDQSDQVPSNYQLWTGFPTSYPLDLTRRNRRVMVSCETWMGVGCAAPTPDYYAWIWQLNLVPSADGTTDGRSNNWWKYITNPNYTAGRGTPNVTKPVVGPFHGAIDLTLTIQQHNILLRWKKEVTQAGSYQVQWSTDRVNWMVATTLPGTTDSWQDGQPAPGVDTFYRVKWTSGATQLLSDVLGANVGGATIVNVSGGQRPVVGLSISLYQTGVPYVRWEIPNSCGLSNGEPHSPCNAPNTGMTCQANVCRTDTRVSDYHGGLAHYQVQKRESGYVNIRTVNRKPNQDQYNDMNFTGADPLATSGAVSGYRVAAFQDDGSGQGLGPFYGQSNLVLAVPNQATVGY